jgi:iron(III) transport system permease protein
MATLATLANFVFAFVAAYLIVRQKVRGRLFMNSLILLPWALPGTVLALSLATTFNQNNPAGKGLAGWYLLASAAGLFHS